MAVRFALKPPKKRQRLDASDKSTPVCSAFSSIEAVCQDRSDAQQNHRLGLLEDAEAKVNRLKEEGNILAEAGKFRAAISRWQEALVVDPNNAYLYELQAQACMAVYDDFQSVQFARKATELAPKWSDGFLTLSRCLLNFGELALALKAIRKAVELNGGVETDEMATDRRDIEMLLGKQEQVLHTRDEEAAHEVEADKLQVISCFKHLSLRAKAIEAAKDK
ncbi:Tetratricopeptide repeat protein 33 [Phytophthora citrophthora]|uniref:Tetratricopeptide repeat protein 33 n=1 Tax=Phytophthora citrophthora TaxID=4793 RepID=A0AAD9LV50_9STRA|nr:Tetratricopeptide repeat protein 33 [Phytophthora citrophthora]